MARVKMNRAQIEAQKAGNLSGFIGGMVNAVGQAGIQKLQNMWEQDRMNEANEAYRDIAERLDAESKRIQTEYDPEQWEAEYNKVKELEFQNLEALDIHNVSKKQARARLEEFNHKTALSFNANGLAIKTEQQNKATKADTDSLLYADVTSTAANSMGSQIVEIPEGVDPEAFISMVESDKARSQAISKGNKNFIDENAQPSFDIEAQDDEEVKPFENVYVRKGASSFDQKMAVAEWRLKKRYPNSPDRVQAELETFRQDLIGTQPKLDTELQFHAEFANKPVSEWDFNSFLAKQEEMLKSSEYGGRKLTLGEREAVLNNTEAKYNEMLQERREAALRTYNTPGGVSEQLTNLQSKFGENPNLKANHFGVEDVEELWEKAFPGGEAKYLLPEAYQSSMNLGRAADRAVAGMRYDELTTGISSGKYTYDEVREELEAVGSVFTSQEKAARTKAIEDAMNYLNQWSADAQTGEVRVNDAGALGTAQETVKNSTSVEEFRNAVEENGWASVLSQDTLDAMEQEVVNNRNQNYTEAANVFVVEDMENDISMQDVNRIAQNYGMLNEDGTVKQEYAPLYKDFKDKALGNDVAAGKAEAMGYATEPVEGATDEFYELAGKYMNGNEDVSLSDLYNTIDNSRSNVTVDEENAMYAEINRIQTARKADSLATFQDKVQTPFMESRDSIMPHELDKMIEESGIDRTVYAEEVAAMEEQARLNLHNQYVGKYATYSQYLALRDVGVSDAEIRKMGLDIPSYDEVDIREYEAQNPEKPFSMYSLIEGEVKNLRVNLIDEKATELDEAIAKQTEDIREQMIDSLRGGTVDKVDSMRVIQYARYGDRGEYYNTVQREFIAGNITSETYDKLIADDLSAYQDPVKKNAIEEFNSYVKNAINISQTDDFRMSDFAIDRTVKMISANFATEYDILESNLGRMPTQAEVDELTGKVFNQMMDDKYFKDGESFVEMMTNPPGVPQGIFSNDSPEINKMLADRVNGTTPMYDQSKFAKMLSDPSGPLDTTESTNLLGSWLQRRREGVLDSEKLGQEILYSVTTNLVSAEGVPDVESENFTEEFEDFYNSLPGPYKNVIASAAVDAKAIVDISYDIERQLGQEVMDVYGEKAPKTVVTNGQIGVQLGDLSVYARVDTKGNVDGYTYLKAGKQVEPLNVTADQLEEAEENFENHFKELVNQTTGKNVAYALTWGYGTQRDASGHKKAVENAIEAMRSDPAFKKSFNRYKSIKNDKAMDVSELTGVEQPIYKDIQITFNEELFEKDFSDYVSKGMKFDVPNYNKYITYELVR